MKKIITILVILLAVGALFGFYKNFTKPKTVKLYFYNGALDQGPGGVACTEKGLQAVDRKVPKEALNVEGAIKLLLKTTPNSEETSMGLTTQLPLTGFELRDVVIGDTVTTLEFVDSQNKTSGGSCRVNILRAQIEATAKQFDGVQNVQILPKEILQP